jgi:hypothetical protein
MEDSGSDFKDMWAKVCDALADIQNRLGRIESVMPTILSALTQLQTGEVRPRFPIPVLYMNWDNEQQRRLFGIGMWGKRDVEPEPVTGIRGSLSPDDFNRMLSHVLDLLTLHLADPSFLPYSHWLWGYAMFEDWDFDPQKSSQRLQNPPHAFTILINKSNRAFQTCYGLRLFRRAKGQLYVLNVEEDDFPGPDQQLGKWIPVWSIISATRQVVEFLRTEEGKPPALDTHKLQQAGTAVEKLVNMDPRNLAALLCLCACRSAGKNLCLSDSTVWKLEQSASWWVALFTKMNTMATRLLEANESGKVRFQADWNTLGEVQDFAVRLKGQFSPYASTLHKWQEFLQGLKKQVEAVSKGRKSTTDLDECLRNYLDDRERLDPETAGSLLLYINELLRNSQPPTVPSKGEAGKVFREEFTQGFKDWQKKQAKDQGHLPGTGHGGERGEHEKDESDQYGAYTDTYP